jgi:hypothetical protein
MIGNFRICWKQGDKDGWTNLQYPTLQEAQEKIAFLEIRLPEYRYAVVEATTTELKPKRKLKGGM